MYQYRITKYDPVNRSSDGAYLVDEWTCHSEIGKSFNGTLFTTEDYLQIEAKHIEAIGRFVRQSQISHLRITNLESGFLEEEANVLRTRFPELYEEAFLSVEVQEDLKIPANDIPIIARMAKRGLINCKLEIADRFFVHFGWDFYMYVGTSVLCKNAIKETKDDGLFVEQFNSPYNEPVGRSPEYTLALCDPEDGIFIREIKFKQSDRELVRKVLGFSDDHTIYGLFAISPEQYQAIKDQLIEQPDIRGYDLVINTHG